MLRLLVLALVLAGCGGGDVSPDHARRAVEEAAGVKLAAVDPPAPEVEAAFSAGEGGHFVQLFVLAEAEDAELLEGLVPATAEGGRVRTAVHENVFVVYTATGDDDAGDAVVAAVEGL
jgi:hypothetical protein